MEPSSPSPLNVLKNESNDPNQVNADKEKENEDLFNNAYALRVCLLTSQQASKQDGFSLAPAEGTTWTSPDKTIPARAGLPKRKSKKYPHPCSLYLSFKKWLSIHLIQCYFFRFSISSLARRTVSCKLFSNTVSTLSL